MTLLQLVWLHQIEYTIPKEENAFKQQANASFKEKKIKINTRYKRVFFAHHHDRVCGFS